MNFYMGHQEIFSQKSQVPSALGLTAGPQDCNPPSVREHLLYLCLPGGILKGKQLPSTTTHALLRSTVQVGEKRMV